MTLGLAVRRCLPATALQTDTHREWLDWYRTLLSVRRAEIVPRLGRIEPDSASARILGHLAVRVLWQLNNGEQLELIANLNRTSIANQWDEAGRTLARCNETASDATLPPWFVSWRILQ